MAHSVLDDHEGIWISTTKNRCMCVLANPPHRANRRSSRGSRRRHSVREKERVIRSFRSGETEAPQPGKPSISLGVKLEIDLHRVIHISRNHIDELPKINTAEYADRGSIRNKTDLRTTSRRALGALIWARRARPDIGFDITKIATDAVAACLEADLDVAIILLYDKTLRIWGDFHRTRRYISLFSQKRESDHTRGGNYNKCDLFLPHIHDLGRWGIRTS